jgi:hypothetical protein
LLKRAFALIIGVLVIGLLMAACGDDNDSNGGEAGGGGNGAVTNDEGSASGDEGAGSEGEEGESGEEGASSISKAAFVKQANQICAEAKQRIGGEVNAAFRGQNNEVEGNAEAITSQILIPGLEAELSELQALGLPNGDEEEVETMLAAIQEIIDEGKADSKTITAQPEPYVGAEKPADKYGISACPLG